MLKVGGVLVCLLIVGLDVAAGILGFQAEVAQNKVYTCQKKILNHLHVCGFSELTNYTRNLEIHVLFFLSYRLII